MRILTAQQMGEVDRLSTETYGIPSIVLMENAGAGVVAELLRLEPDLRNSRIAILCGKGNNGGDGFVVARHLVMRGANPRVYLLADPAHVKGDAKTNLEIIQRSKIALEVLPEPARWDNQCRFLAEADIIIDALFGTGLARPLGKEYAALIDSVNRWSRRARVISVDLPSGLIADRSEVPGPAIRAHHTVTFSTLKLALVLSPAASFAGAVSVADIGSPRELIHRKDHRIELIDAEVAGRALPPRRRDSHKGDFGHVFVVAGSRGKSGAALMAGMAALRSGAGLVTLWLCEGLQKQIVGKFPELMTEWLPETSSGTIHYRGLRKIASQLDRADALVLGPGIGTHPSTRRFVHQIVRESPIPIVLDADGLNAFASESDLARNEQKQAMVVTPHPGEMSRLIGKSTREVQINRLGVAREFSLRHGAFVILKGSQTIVCGPDGHIMINTTGNAGMATAGTGDILAGIVGRFVATWSRASRGVDLFGLRDYLATGVYVHGLAGDLVARKSGMESLTATDLLPELSKAFKMARDG